MLIIGIKYCGGCNPRYDRKELLAEIVEQLESSEIRFEYVRDGEIYDYLIILGGCTNCCASYEDIIVRGEVFKIREKSDGERIIAFFEGETYGLEKIL